MRRLGGLIDANAPSRGLALFAAKFVLGYEYVDLLPSGTVHMFDLVGTSGRRAAATAVTADAKAANAS